MTHKNTHDIPVPPTPAAPAPATATPPSPTEADLTQLHERAAKADENWDKYLRAVADLDNYRKRVARERDDLLRAANERVVAALLPVLDNLERALAAAEQHQTDPAALLDGVKQIQIQFRRTLEQFGLQEVAAHAGHPFDPNLHEAVSHVEHPDHPEGAVAQQLQRGYKLADRLLRPARVVVSKGKTPPTP